MLEQELVYMCVVNVFLFFCIFFGVCTCVGWLSVCGRWESISGLWSRARIKIATAAVRDALTHSFSLQIPAPLCRLVLALPPFSFCRAAAFTSNAPYYTVLHNTQQRYAAQLEWRSALRWRACSHSPLTGNQYSDQLVSALLQTLGGTAASERRLVHTHRCIHPLGFQFWSGLFACFIAFLNTEAA